MSKLFLLLSVFLGMALAAEEISFQKDPKIIILLGPPGVGKGTQAKMISTAFHIPHISTGDILREQVRINSVLGKEAKEYMDQGKLVPDALILNMLFERVSQPDCKNGYILDGFPRTIEQAKAFHKRLDNAKKVITLNLQVDDETLVDRITHRMICKDCGKPYHLKYSPPKKEGICDTCGGALYQRSDDTKEVVLKRLSIYRDQTEPLIAFYEERKNLSSIPAGDTQEKIFSKILEYLR